MLRLDAKESALRESQEIGRSVEFLWGFAQQEKREGLFFFALEISALNGAGGKNGKTPKKNISGIRFNCLLPTTSPDLTNEFRKNIEQDSSI
jgi:hypothetical protein